MIPLWFVSFQQYVTTGDLLQLVSLALVAFAFVVLFAIWAEIVRLRRRFHDLANQLTILTIAFEMKHGYFTKADKMAEDPKAPVTDPGYVFKMIGLVFMAMGVVNASGLILAMAFKGIKIENKFTLIFMLVAITLPILSGMMLASDKIRDRILDWADKTSFIPFRKKD